LPIFLSQRGHWAKQQKFPKRLDLSKKKYNEEAANERIARVVHRYPERPMWVEPVGSTHFFIVSDTKPVGSAHF
jgi:hypothetical protein